MKTSIAKSMLAAALCSAAFCASADFLLTDILDAASSIVDVADSVSPRESIASLLSSVNTESESPQENAESEETKQAIQNWKPETQAVTIGSYSSETILSLKFHTYSEWVPQELYMGGSATILLKSIPRLMEGGSVDTNNPVWFGVTEVTQAQWEAVMGNNPSCFKGADNPVERVSWDDCQKFISKLNSTPSVAAAKLTFRLPTEKEWEFACRAGATGDGCRLEDGSETAKDTLDQIAWFAGNSKRRPHPVGQKKPNAFGLFDMLGNVWEWTSTESDEHRVYRGGAWSYEAGFCQPSYRCRFAPDFRLGSLGLRLCADTEE